MEDMHSLSGTGDDLDVPGDVAPGQIMLLNGGPARIRALLDQGPAHRVFDRLRTTPEH